MASVRLYCGTAKEAEHLNKMDRRKSLQTLILGTGASALAFYGCKTDEATDQNKVKIGTSTQDSSYYGRTPNELERISELQAEQLFSEHDIETIGVLSEIILPPKEPNGGPIEAEVPEFIEFISKDIPELQPTLVGGLMWLDHESNTRFSKEFKVATLEEQKQILDTIAYHNPEIPLEQQALEIQFFALMRNLTVTGYYTSKVGIDDLGYKGNQPNIWDGVPQHILDQHQMSYDPEWLKKCVDQSKRNEIAVWDDKGNLLT